MTSRRDYEGDVVYEVWRRGGNVDAINMDRLADRYYDGYSPDEAADAELRRQRPPEPEYPEPECLEAPDGKG